MFLQVVSVKVKWIVRVWTVFPFILSSLSLPFFQRDAHSGSKVDFLLPGFMVERLSLERNASVGYLVVSEAFGVRDSTEVRIDVTGTDDGRVEVRVESFALSMGAGDSLSVIIRFSSDVFNVATAGELKSAVEEVLYRTGSERYRRPTEQEMEDFGLDRIFIERGPGMREVVLDSELVSTPAGSFNCSVVELEKVEKRRVDLGGVAAERCETSRIKLWRSDEVPVFGLVRSRLERTRRLVPLGSGDFPLSRPRVTVTEAILLSNRVK